MPLEFNKSKALLPIFIFIGFFVLALLVNVKIALIAFLAISAYLFFSDKKFIIVLFIAFLPTNGMIKNEFYLFSLINIDNVINILAIIVILMEYKSHNPISKLQRFSIKLILIILGYIIFLSFKDSYFGLFNMDYQHAVVRSINYVIKFIPLILIIRRIDDSEIRSLCFTGFFVGVIILCFSTFYSDKLAIAGFKTSNIEIEQTLNSEISRNSGVFGNGDKNSLGVFLVMFIGFYLSVIEKRKISNYYFIAIGISLLGILSTVSRTATISLLFVFAIYSFRNKITTLFKIALLIVMVILLLPQKITPIIERFQYSEKELDYKGSSSRVGKWISYLKHVGAHPNILVTGNTNNYYLNSWAASKNYLVASHNLYVEMLYRGGAIFLILIVFLYASFCNYILKTKLQYNVYYILFPFLFVTFYTPDWGSFYYLVVYLSMNSTEIT